MILFFYTALKPIEWWCSWLKRLMILFFYTALKHSSVSLTMSCVWWSFSFTLLSNEGYGSFGGGSVWWSFSFTLLSNAYTNQNIGGLVWWSFSFTLLSNIGECHIVRTQFDDPFLLHCSQTVHNVDSANLRLMILFFYTALKRGKEYV